MSIGKRIYELRLKYKLSQEDISKTLFITRQTLSKWEKDESIPDVESIIKLSKIFNVSTDYLLKEDDLDTPEGKERVKQEESRYEKLRRHKELTFLTYYDYAILVINVIAVVIFFFGKVFLINPICYLSSLVIFVPAFCLGVMHLLGRIFLNSKDNKGRALICEAISLLIYLPLIILYGV